MQAVWEKPVAKLIKAAFLDQVEDAKNVFSPKEQAQLAQLTSDEAINALLQSDVGSTVVPDLKKAMKMFSQIERANVSMPAMITTLEFFTLAQLVKFFETNHQLLQDKSIKGADRVLAHRASLEAIERFSAIVGRIKLYAATYAKEKRRAKFKPEKPIPKVTGMAPPLD